MIRPTTRSRKTSESGASAVEFALVVPFLVLILGGILDFGFIFSQQIALNNAARDAARAGVVSNLAGAGLTCAQISTKLTNSLTSSAVGLSSAAVNVTVSSSATDPSASCTANTANKPCTKSSAGDQLTVVATFNSSPPFPLPYLNGIQVRGQGIFQCEYT
ncbi:TadE/TadG family type IV pilus assembly protein [Phycicoccus sp. Root101]|uniref:TadE/TadG family type IV pilus assembly protein n=1 Tax=Phycicoccus sp. Root101 TaxID=1736421 RepID=UPI0009E87E08|nr:TadE/TadG family type IV pilus assembly protein [Phycicoccus sp. Root101]